MAIEIPIRLKVLGRKGGDTSGTGGTSGGDTATAKAIKKNTKVNESTGKKIVGIAGKVGILATVLASIRSVIDPLFQVINYFVFTSFASLVKWVSELVENVKSIFTKEFWQGVGEWLMTQAENLWEYVKTIFANGLQKVKEIGTMLWEEYFAPAFETVKEWGLRIWENYIVPGWERIKEAGQWIWDNVIIPGWESLKEAGKWIWETILEPAWGFLKDVGSWIWEQIIKPGFDFLKDIGSKIWEHMKSAFTWGIDVGAKLWSWVKSKLSFGGNKEDGSKAFGGTIPKDGLYRMHAGEQVSRGNTTNINKSMNPSISINLGNNNTGSMGAGSDIAQAMIRELKGFSRW